MYSRSSSVPGDVTATMAVYKGVKDSDRFRDDVKNRIVTHVIIKKHPYEIRFFKQLMDKIYFELKDQCKMQTIMGAKMPTCASPDMFDNNDQLLHVLGYIPI
jgi:hypothetical protein